MHQTELTRRILLGSATAALASFGPGARAQANIRLRSMWWGSQDRSRRTNEVAKLFESKTGIAVSGEPVGNDYWPKLATQMAGRNVSDVFQLEPFSLADYAKRGACRQLDEFIGKSLDLSSFDPKMIDLCKVDGKTFGVGLGLNSFSMFSNRAVMEAAKLPLPSGQMSWDEYGRLAVETTKAVNREGYWGSGYGARYYSVLDVWLRQRGKSLFRPDGTLGFVAEDAAEWFAYWEDLRNKGGTVSAEVQALDQNQIDSNALALGKCAMNFTWSNQLIGYQLLTKDPLAINSLPRTPGSDRSGHYYRPALIWSMGSTTKNPEAAARYISFFVTDLEAGKILGVERGVPMSRGVREAVAPTLNEVERTTIEYVSSLQEMVTDYPPPAPIGAVEFERNVLRRVADQIAFGKTSIGDGAKQLVTEGASVLRG